MSEELRIAIICRRFKWTYQQYVSQPAWFLDRLEMIQAEDGKK